MNRSSQRQWIIKIIFQMDFNEESNIDEVLINHELENEPFIRESVVSILENQEQIDSLISDNLTSWTIDRLPKIEKAILRTSVNEFIIQKSVPVQVSINEAVEIAKQYSDQDSYKFINGVLSAIARKHHG
ncbi:MAG: transcription antitermination factor NusB [Tissierellia bacterium]|nr:transcription antitermination factor NusB [Tissierellia bacterium]